MANTELDIFTCPWKILPSKYFELFIYTQYPIIRNGDQRPPVEFLKISKILDSHRFLFYHASLVTVS